MSSQSNGAKPLIDIETASVALKKSHLRETEMAYAGLGHFQDLDITRYAVDPLALVQLASRYQLTAYDAAYLLVASELRAPLLTFDQRLGEAARQHLASLP